MRALDLTTDRTRLTDYYAALTTDPDKRAEFAEALREVDDYFVCRLLAGLPDRNDSHVYREGVRNRMMYKVARRRVVQCAA